jgi:hypothetical protein
MTSNWLKQVAAKLKHNPLYHNKGYGATCHKCGGKEHGGLIPASMITSANVEHNNCQVCHHRYTV